MPLTRSLQLCWNVARFLLFSFLLLSGLGRFRGAGLCREQCRTSRGSDGLIVCKRRASLEACPMSMNRSARSRRNVPGSPSPKALAAFEGGVHRLAAFGGRSESTDPRPMLRLVNEAEARPFYLEPLDTPCLKVSISVLTQSLRYCQCQVYSE